MRLRAVAASALCAVAATAVAQADSVVEVDPLVGTPDTAFHVEVAASFPIRQVRDRYWFVLHGPGGRHCETTVTDRVGITPLRRARRVAVDLPGVRVVSSRQIVPGPWCEGTFRGHVEFRDWRPRTRRYLIHRIGTFSVRVEPGK
jgi:hypothetical protein